MEGVVEPAVQQAVGANPVGPEMVQASIDQPAGDSIVQQIVETVTEMVKPAIQPEIIVTQSVDNPIVSEQVGENVVETVSQFVNQPVEPILTELTTQATFDVVTEAATETVADIVSEVITEAPREASTFFENVVETFATDSPSIVEPIVQSVVEPVAEPVVQSFAEPVVEFVTEPVVESITESVIQPVAESIVEPITETALPAEVPLVQEAIQASDPIVEMVNEVVTETQTELNTLLTGDEASSEASVTPTSLAARGWTTDSFIQWLQESHLIMTVSVSMLYLFIVCFIRRLLSKRSPFHLKTLLFLWNLIKVGLTIGQVIVTTQYFSPVLINYGLFNGLRAYACMVPFPSLLNLEAIAFWMHIITWLRFVEFGDTLFTVLRKQQVTVFHLYYRISTFVYAFYMCGQPFIPSYYMLMVSTHLKIQFFMNIYYLARCRTYLASKWIVRSLNLLNLIHGFAFTYTLGLSWYHHLYNVRCSAAISTDAVGLFVLTSNLILFMNHLRSSVVKPKHIKLL